MYVYLCCRLTPVRGKISLWGSCNFLRKEKNTGVPTIYYIITYNEQIARLIAGYSKNFVIFYKNYAF